MKKLLTAVAFLLSFTVLSFAAEPVNQTAPEPKAVQESKPQAFTIAKLVVATGVENKEPVGAASKLPASNDRAYVYLEAKDIAQDTPVAFVWYFEGKQLDKISLQLKKGSRWRTYSNKKIAGQKGNWKVDLVDGEGNILKTVTFVTE